MQASRREEGASPQGWQGTTSLTRPSAPLPAVSPGFLGEGDAVTKAIQDARQLLHSHSGALDASPSAPFRKVCPTLGGRGGTEAEATAGKQGREWGEQRGLITSSLSPQDLIGVDTSPAKERLEDSCVHPLEEAMLGCDMDGEDLRLLLLPARARAGQGSLSATLLPSAGRPSVESPYWSLPCLPPPCGPACCRRLQ